MSRPRNQFIMKRRPGAISGPEIPPPPPMNRQMSAQGPDEVFAKPGPVELDPKGSPALPTKAGTAPPSVSSERSRHMMDFISVAEGQCLVRKLFAFFKLFFLFLPQFSVIRVVTINLVQVKLARENKKCQNENFHLLKNFFQIHVRASFYRSLNCCGLKANWAVYLVCSSSFVVNFFYLSLNFQSHVQCCTRISDHRFFR